MRTIKLPNRTASAELVLVALVTAAGLLAAWWVASASVRVQAPVAKYYNSYSCEARHRLGDAVFRILDVFRLDTDKLADRLCASPTIGLHYASVEVVWMHRDQLDLREIVNQSYQLVLAKPEVLARFTPMHSADYVPLLGYQDYVGQLLAVKYAPELSNEFLAGKRLGLLDDPNSQSGYQIPKAALRRAHIDESALTTVFFKSHADLHRALFAGDVDVIASYFAAYFGDDRASVKRLDLQQGLSGMQWYVHPALMRTLIQCELVRTLIDHRSVVGAPTPILDSDTVCASAD